MQALDLIHEFLHIRPTLSRIGIDISPNFAHMNFVINTQGTARTIGESKGNRSLMLIPILNNIIKSPFVFEQLHQVVNSIHPQMNDYESLIPISDY